MASGIILSRRSVGGSTNFAVRLPGGTTEANSVYGQGASTTLFNLGTQFRLRLRHRPIANNAQYLLSLNNGPTQFALIRHYVSNRYELYGQTPSGTVVRESLPVDTVPGTWYDIDFRYDGVTLRGFLNGAELVTKALSFVAPSDPAGMSLKIGTASAEYGSDHGDYDFARIERNGAILCDYQFTEGVGTIAAETAQRVTPISSIGIWNWIQI